MSRREARSLIERRCRAALLNALRVLRTEARQKRATAATQLRVARAYRALGRTAEASGFFRSALAGLRTTGDAVRALAVAKELSDLSGNARRYLGDLARKVGGAGATTAPRRPRPRAAQPLPPNAGRVARPLEPRVRDEPVVSADLMVKVHDASEVATPIDDGAGPPSLVPPDVLEELAQRGELVVVQNTLIPPDVLAELQTRGEIDILDAPAPGMAEPEMVDTDDVVLESAGDEEPLSAEAAGAEVEEDPAEPVLAAHARAEGEEPIDTEEVIDNLARVPLFSDLPRAAFVELARSVSVVPFETGQVVFQEGEAAPSFYLVADGSFEAQREVRGAPTVLKQAGVGEVFGLFGVFADGRRAATVRAMTDSLAIEIPRAALDRVLAHHPAAKEAVARFYRERLLNLFLASSPLFADLDEAARADLARRFRERKLGPSDVLVAPGEVFNGLFLVLNGVLRIHRRSGPGSEEDVAQIKRGQFFGVVSALSGIPMRVQVTAVDPGSVCYLPPKAFNDFVKDHPSLRTLPAKLAEEGMLVEKDIFVGKTGIPGLS